MERVIFHLWRQRKHRVELTFIINCVFHCKMEVIVLTPSLVKNSKAARSRFLADSMGDPSFQGRRRVGNPNGSAPTKHQTSMFTMLTVIQTNASILVQMRWWTTACPLSKTRAPVLAQLQYQFHRRSASSRLRTSASPPSSSPSAPAHRNTDLWPAVSHNTSLLSTIPLTCVFMYHTYLFCTVVLEAHDVSRLSAGSIRDLGNACTAETPRGVQWNKDFHVIWNICSESSVKVFL